MNCECLDDWRQEGSVSMWRYTKSSRHRHPGLNLRADTPAIRSLVGLTRCLAEGASGTRTIHLAEPARGALAIPGFDSEYEWFRGLKIRYEKQDVGIVFAVARESLELTVGHAGLLILRGALERYDRGDRDFAMPCEVSGAGKYDRALWFLAAG
jgi:hypothetical protein